MKKQQGDSELTRFLKFAPEFVRQDWVRAVVLFVSATQTYFVVSWFAPSFAFWLPAFGVLLMEVGVVFWQFREQEADAITIIPTKPGKKRSERNYQGIVATIMVGMSIATSAVTMLGGALLEVESSRLSTILKANDATTSFFGWSAITGIFLLGTTNLIADWIYRRYDPDLIMKRDHRSRLRELHRKETSTLLGGETHILNHQVRTLRKRFRREARRLGRARARESFDRVVNKDKRK